MMKPTILNILFFWIIKYLIFYVFLMFKNEDYSLLKIVEMKSANDLFYYFWVFLFLPILFMILLSIPLYFLFKIKRIIYFIIVLAMILVSEFFIYTLLASTSDLMNGIYNGIISVIFLFLFFFRTINRIFKAKRPTI